MTDASRLNAIESAQDDQNWQITVHTGPPEPIEYEESPLDQVLKRLRSLQTINGPLQTINASEVQSSGEIPTSSQTSIPSYFPTEIVQIIERIPFVIDGTTVHNIQQSAVFLFSTIFRPDSPDSMAVLQQIGALMDRLPTSKSELVSQMLLNLITSTIYLDPGTEFTLLDLADAFVIDFGQNLLNSIVAIPDAVLQEIFGCPIQGTNIADMFSHIWITTVSASPPEFTVELEECESNCFKPKLTKEFVGRFVDSLPKVAVDSLDVDERECGICREPYGEVSASEPEEAVKLPCGHVLGKECLTVMIASWRHQSCPLCRRTIALFPETPLSRLLDF